MEEKISQIPLVKLGSQGFEVSRLGFGCGGLSGILNAPLSHEEGISLLKEAFNRGITLFDTANIYGEDNHNEIMIGKFLKQLPREKVQLATKFGVYILEDGQFGVKGTPEYARESCEASLKRLGVDYIDLYYQHRVDTQVPIEDTIGELKKLVDEGKIRYIGLSEANVDTIRRAHAVHPITAVQMEYSLWTREVEDEIIPLCRELGIGIVAYSPLGHGFFGYASKVHWGKFRQKQTFILETCQPSSEAFLHCASAGFGMASPSGRRHNSNSWTTKLKNLESNVEALAVKLTQEDLKEISDLFPVDNVHGARELDMLSKFSWTFANTPPKQ